MSKVYIGIDPGKNGAITIIEDNEISFYLIPVIKGEIDILELNEIFRVIETLPCHVIIEDVHAIFGVAASATFEFGRVCGLLEGMIVSHGLSYTKVQPKEWQKLCFQGIPEIRKPAKENKKGVTVKGKLDTKPMAAIAAKRLFPKESFKATERCKKDHDGIIDSLLLAYYGKTKQL